VSFFGFFAVTPTDTPRHFRKDVKILPPSTRFYVASTTRQFFNAVSEPEPFVNDEEFTTSTQTAKSKRTKAKQLDTNHNHKARLASNEDNYK
jgi:hypothetical protein